MGSWNVTFRSAICSQMQQHPTGHTAFNEDSFQPYLPIVHDALLARINFPIDVLYARPLSSSIPEAGMPQPYCVLYTTIWVGALTQDHSIDASCPRLTRAGLTVNNLRVSGGIEGEFSFRVFLKEIGADVQRKPLINTGE